MTFSVLISLTADVRLMVEVREAIEVPCVLVLVTVVVPVIVVTAKTVGLRSNEQYCEACESSVGLLARMVDCEEQKGTDEVCFVTTHLQRVSSCLAEYRANGEVVLGLAQCQYSDQRPYVCPTYYAL